MTRLDQRLAQADPLDGQLPEALASPLPDSEQQVTITYAGTRRRRHLGWAAGLVGMGACGLIVAVVAGGLFGDGGSDSPGPAGPPGETGRLVLTKSLVRGPIYVEGSVTAVLVEREADGEFVVDELRPVETLDVPLLDIELPAGRYIVRTAERPCNGDCSQLDPADPQTRVDPRTRCTVPVDIRPGATTTVRIALDANGAGGPLCGIAAPTDIDQRRPTDLVPDDLPVAALRDAGEPLSAEHRESLQRISTSNPSLNPELGQLLLDNDEAQIVAGPTAEGLCFVALLGPDFSGGPGACPSAAEIRNGGGFNYSYRCQSDPEMVRVVGIAPDGAGQVDLLRNGEAIDTTDVVNNAFHLAGRDADGLRIGDLDAGIDFNGPC